MHVQYNVLVYLHNHCFCGNKTMHSLCIVELNAVNIIKIMSVVQEYFYGKFMLLVTIKCTSWKYSVVLSDFKQVWSQFLDRFSWNSPLSYSLEICPEGADRGADWCGEGNWYFSWLCEHIWKLVFVWLNCLCEMFGVFRILFFFPSPRINL